MKMMKNNKNETIMVIGIDHGYGNMKTATRCFPSGVARNDKEPIFQNNLLVYNGMYYQIGEEHKEFCAEKTQDDDYYVLTLAAIANYERVRAEAERTNGADEELAGYYRQVEAACEGAGGVTGASDGRERRVTGEKSEDEIVQMVEKTKSKAVIVLDVAAEKVMHVQKRLTSELTIILPVESSMLWLMKAIVKMKKKNFTMTENRC